MNPPAYIRDDGSFDIALPADVVKSELKLTVIDEQGNITEQPLMIDPGQISTVKALAPPKALKIALVFANSKYSQNGIPDLDTPSRDAAIVKEALQTKFGFDARVIENATKAQIIGAIKSLRSEVSEQDQVLIYYAGHGYEDAKTGTGYWLPVDATTTSAKNWLSTTDAARSERVNDFETGVGLI